MPSVGLMIAFTCTNTSVLIGRRLTTRTARAWTIGARISVELEGHENREGRWPRLIRVDGKLVRLDLWAITGYQQLSPEQKALARTAQSTAGPRLPCGAASLRQANRAATSTLAQSLSLRQDR